MEKLAELLAPEGRMIVSDILQNMNSEPSNSGSIIDIQKAEEYLRNSLTSASFSGIDHIFHGHIGKKSILTRMPETLQKSTNFQTTSKVALVCSSASLP